SNTVTTRAGQVVGVTSPRPKVKNVVPLMYTSIAQLGGSLGEVRREPKPYWISPNPRINPPAQIPRRNSSDDGPKILNRVSRLRLARMRPTTLDHARHVER